MMTLPATVNLWGLMFHIRRIFPFILAFFLACPVSRGGVDFDGTDDYLTCQSLSAVDDQEPFSIYAVIEPDTNGELNVGVILYKDIGDATGGGWNFRFNSTYQIMFKKDYSTQDLIVRSINNSITASTIQRVLMTWDGSATATNVHLYVNGTEVSYSVQTNATGTKGSDASNNLLIGNDTTQGQTFDGRIEEVALWNKVLSANEISQLSNSRTRYLPLQISPSNLKFYQVLDECSDTSTCSGSDQFKDRSGNGSSCTATNSPIGKAMNLHTYP